MLSTYGKILRKIRIDKAELLGNMAQKLNISPAYLSAIENNDRPVPVDLTDKIIELYNLPISVQEELRTAEQDSIKTLKLKLPKETNNIKRQTALLFARTFNNIDKESLEKIRLILSGGGDDYK